MIVAVGKQGEPGSASHGAGEWIRDFHPDVSVVLDEAGQVLLSSPLRGERALRALWDCCIANERLLVANEQGRGRIVAMLTE